MPSMTSRRGAGHLARAAAPLLLALTFGAGCGDEVPEVVGPGPIRTVANSPENALQLMTEAFVNRDTLVYGGLFTSDYVFHVRADTVPLVTGTLDLGWSQEMTFARNCFRLGTSNLGAAKTIVCDLGPLVPVPDERPGMDPTWHQRIACTMVMSVDALDTIFEVNEPLWVYFVRGDSAATTSGIRGTSDLPENERWYIVRVEPAPAASYPQQFAFLKQAYLVP